MPSYLPFSEAWGGGCGTECCGSLNRGKRETKEKANIRSRVRLADEKNYRAAEQKELREHKLMPIGSGQKGLFDLWYFFKNQCLDYLAERVIVKLPFNDFVSELCLSCWGVFTLMHETREIARWHFTSALILH